MGSVFYSCGCSVSCSMFEPYSIMFVNPCSEHKQVEQVQIALKALSKAVGDVANRKKK